MSEAIAFGPIQPLLPDISRLTVIPHVPAETVPSTPLEVVTPAEPIVRGATHEDIPALVEIELSAYANVYGNAPDTHIVTAVEQKYRERVDLLGKYIRVLETPEAGVYGMIVCCPTNLSSEELVNSQLDMTDNSNVRAIYDPEGENGYIVNLAIRPDKQGAGESAKLFADAIQLGIETGVKRTYFESRLPGLTKWITKQLGPNEAEWNVHDVHQLAERYWQTTRTLPNGTVKPIDPLLRAYVGVGATPLKLIRDAWTVDTPSQGYGVLCELTIPHTTEPPSGETVTTNPETVNELVLVHNDRELADGESAEPEVAADPSFLRGVFQWVKARKTPALLGGALLGTAYGIATGGGQEIVEDVKENAPWVVSAYTASMAAYFGSAAAILAKVGQSGWRRAIGFNPSELGSVPDELRKSPLVRTGFWVNTGSALSAAGVATAGIVETLPPSAWSALAIPAIDVYSTIVLRKWLYGKVIRKK